MRRLTSVSRRQGWIFLLARSIRAMVGIALVLFCFPHSGGAETIQLKSGQKLDVKITARFEDHVSVDFFGTTVEYYFDEIESIDGKSPEPAPVAARADVVDAAGGSGGAFSVGMVADKISFEGGAADHAQDFSDQFSKLLTHLEAPKALAAEFAVMSGDLCTFDEKYPDSKFSKDAAYLCGVVPFMRMVQAQDKEKAWKAIRDIEKIVARYPQGDLDPAVRRALIKGGQENMLFRVPFEYAVPCMQGYWGVHFKYPQLVLDGFSVVKDKIDPAQQENIPLLKEVYRQLLATYRSLGVWDKVKKIIEEAKAKGLPHDVWLDLE